MTYDGGLMGTYICEVDSIEKEGVHIRIRDESTGNGDPYFGAAFVSRKFCPETIQSGGAFFLDIYDRGTQNDVGCFNTRNVDPELERPFLDEVLSDKENS